MSKKISLGEAIELHNRRRLGISQDKLSKLAGVAFHTIAKIEAGLCSLRPVDEKLPNLAAWSSL